MRKDGWILLYKKFQEWEWYDYPSVKIIFLHCLLEANFKDEPWQGQLIKRGQFPTSIEKLAMLNGLTLQQTRNALKKLQTTNEINIQTTNRYSIITVKNYDLYQTNNKQKTPPNNKPTLGGCNKQIGGSNNNTIKNIKKERDNKLSLSISEREILEKYLLKQKRKTPIEDIDAYISTLSKNGDLENKLNKAKQWQERQKKKEEESKNKAKQKEEECVETPEEEEKIKQIQERIKNDRRKKSFNFKNQN